MKVRLSVVEGLCMQQHNMYSVRLAQKCSPLVSEVGPATVAGRLQSSNSLNKHPQEVAAHQLGRPDIWREHVALWPSLPKQAQQA